MNKIAILSDLHVPYHNREYVDRACAEVKEEKPDTIVIDGDLLDFPSISKFAQVPGQKISLTDQLNMAWGFLSDLRRENPLASIYYIIGNHDFRMRSYLIRATEKMDDDMRQRIYSRALDLREDLQLDKLDIQMVDTLESASKWTDTFKDFEGVIIGHFDTVSNPTIPAGQTIRNIMMKKVRGKNCVQAHIHRGAVIWDTDLEGNKVFGMETPCLCLPATYRSIQNWQYGYSMLTRNKDGEWRPELRIF